MFLYLKVKLSCRIKTYMIQCQKPVIDRNHPAFIFSNTEEKKKHTKQNIVL